MRKSCKRKVYALVNPISMAIEGACVTDEQRLEQLASRELQAIQDMTTGKGTLKT
jgi:hypothetical protein